MDAMATQGDANPQIAAMPAKKRSLPRKTGVGFPQKPPRFPLEVTHALATHASSTAGHREPRIVLVLSGSGQIIVEACSAEVSSGFVFLIPAGAGARVLDAGNLELRVIAYHPSSLGMRAWQITRTPGYLSLFPVPAKRRKMDPRLHGFRLAPQSFERAVALAGEIRREITQGLDGWQDVAKLHFQHLIVLLSRFHNLRVKVSADSARRVARAVQRMEHEFATDLQMAELARESAMSLRTFFRVFHKATGQTPNKYLKRVRLNHAAEKLRLSDQTITEVAFACGFNNSNFFSREFNHDYGMSPSNYRRIWQG